MRARPLALAAGLLLCGCAQTLTVKVHRYDVDAVPESRARYADARRGTRTAAQARDQVDAARVALASYKGCLRSLNVLVQELLPGLPDREGVKAAKKTVIDASFQETEAVLAKMAQQLSALAADDPAPSFEAQPVRVRGARRGRVHRAREGGRMTRRDGTTSSSDDGTTTCRRFARMPRS
jgi:hypothetical protein